MAPHRNHVEVRSNRVPARQYVSETHDHKPDAPDRNGPELFSGILLEVDDIALGYRVLTSKIRDLKASIEMKQAIPAKHAADDIAKIAAQINTMASHLAGVFTKHVNRKART